MSESTFPQSYRNADGVELIAKDDVQASVFEREGFKLVKPTKKPTTEDK